MKVKFLSSLIDATINQQKLIDEELRKEAINSNSEMPSSEALSISDSQFNPPSPVAKSTGLLFALELEAPKVEKDGKVSSEENMQDCLSKQAETFESFQTILHRSSPAKQLEILENIDMMATFYEHNSFMTALKKYYLNLLKTLQTQIPKIASGKVSAIPVEKMVHPAILTAKQSKKFIVDLSNAKIEPAQWDLCVKQIIHLIRENKLKSFVLLNLHRLADEDGKGIFNIMEAIGKTSSIESINLKGSLYYREMGVVKNGDSPFARCNRTKVAMFNMLRNNKTIIEFQYDSKAAFSDPSHQVVNISLTDPDSEAARSPILPKHSRQPSLSDIAQIEGLLDRNKKLKLEEEQSINNGTNHLIHQELSIVTSMLNQLIEQGRDFKTRPARNLLVKLNQLSEGVESEMAALFKKMDQQESKALKETEGVTENPTANPTANPTTKPDAAKQTSSRPLKFNVVLSMGNISGNNKADSNINLDSNQDNSQTIQTKDKKKSFTLPFATKTGLR